LSHFLFNKIIYYLYRCQQFGSGDFLKVFAEFNTTTSFSLNPAVRWATGACIEEVNCNWELATVCAFNQTDISGSVKFLACMDEKEGTAKSASKLCAKATGLDETQIMTCYSGAQGQSLLKEASGVFDKAFPLPTSVPHILVNGQKALADYQDLKTAICAAGSTAPACSNVILECSA